MTDLRRNQIKISYRQFIRSEEIPDEYGNPSGSYNNIYGEPQELYISVSANRGDYSVQQFGNLLDYDRVMIISDKDCPIDENSRVYIDGILYLVKAVARSLNASQYAIKRAEISETD